MRVLLQLIKVFWSGRNRPISADDCLKPLVTLIIALIAGPDIVAAVELTTLLELFGAAMFLLSFSVGLKLFGFAALERLRQLLLPAQYVALVAIRGLPGARVHGIFLICRHNLGLCCLACAWVVAFIQLVR